MDAVQPNFELVFDKERFTKQYFCLQESIPLAECFLPKEREIDDGSVEEPDDTIIEEPLPPLVSNKSKQTVTHSFRNYFALPIELPDEMCFDNIDNDLNGLVDCADAACSESCVEICDNGIDDDGDNTIDCDDEECEKFNICTPLEICNNNIDDDGDTPWIALILTVHHVRNQNCHVYTHFDCIAIVGYQTSNTQLSTPIGHEFLMVTDLSSIWGME